MKRLVPALALVVASCSSSGDPSASGVSSVQTGDRPTIVTVELRDWSGEMRALSLAGYDLAGVDLESQRVDVVVSAEERAALVRAGYRIVGEVPVPDTGNEVAPEQYKAPVDVENALRLAAERHPEIARTTSIGKTNEGRDIWAIAIGRPSSMPKPRILFNGAHHAREVMTVEVALDTVETLLERYGTDEAITHWVNDDEIWVVPMLNADGSERVANGETFRRKNTRGCPASGSCSSRTGVDINRNYAHGWGSCNGSSGSPSADNYRGPSAASEPETRALMGLVEKIRPVFDLSYHSYSELVLYPYGCRGQYAPVRALFEGIGREMAARLPVDDGTGTYRAGTPWELLYSADGGDMDWMFHDHDVMAFAIELNGSRQGFRPPYATWRSRTVEKARAAWQYLLARVDGPGIRGIVHDEAGHVVTEGRVETVDTSGSSIARTVGGDGSFHVVVAPGTFRVTVSAPGHAPWVRDVDVGSSRVDVDVRW
jgi:carboxypeptidase T